MTFVSKFKKEEDGTILIFVALCLAMILGFAALTFDLGRMASTQTDLQSYADHVALAAAGELDGNADAITRARTAAENMIADRQFFADGDQTLDSAADFSLRFLTGLPDPAVDPDDDDAVDGFLTNDASAAIMVEVQATPRTVFLPFARGLATLLGAAVPNEQVGATAIAGYTGFACDVTPLMFCIPGGWTANANVGQAIQLRTGGNDSAWGPGNFGFLDPQDIGINPNGPCAGLNGSSLYICLIAAEGNLTKCVSQRGVDTEPGQRNGIGSAIYNSRFDLFLATMNSLRNDPAYAPGPQVIAGWENSTGQCLKNNPTISDDTMPFPRDDCFDAGNCATLVPEGAGRFGDGDWDDGRAAYLATNYGTGTDPLNPLQPHPLIADGTISLPTGNTRYQMYLDEITKFAGRDILEGRSETGRRQCASTTNPDPDRRTFIAAAIDCDANPVVGRAVDVPVQEFVKVFLIQPLEQTSGTDFDIYVEVVEQVGGAGVGIDEGIFRDVVRLYR
ncbi:pilus assembly protein TadG-related protein [Ruegeria lacuscaerulensis]|uniref:pilus assembly protein TadG-related protein n=1 Tax=Ruegeria lacuscaerulensis TaxID=55218 RepID=UPI00147AE85E|nr:Tad domain-containing protein [Ruegeria lacuscaerulensis]